MSAFIRIVQDDESAVELGPPKPFACVDGHQSHEWMLTIEEGRVELATDCNLCTDGLRIWSDDDLFEMSAAIRVRVTIEHEPGQPQYGIDPHVWIDLTPG